MRQTAQRNFLQKVIETAAGCTAVEHIELASKSPMVRQVIARTLPEQNASPRVPERVGMPFVGEVMDPEDGRVWRWQVKVGA